jgi:hypothetical protein
VAKLGARRSKALGFSRRLYDTKIARKGLRITFKGKLAGSLAKRARRVTITLAPGCSLTGGKVISRARVRHGRFTVRFNVPVAMIHYGLVTLRAQTVVTKPHTHRKMKVTGLTRVIHV